MKSDIFELVLHHNYTIGSAEDLSGHSNHGHISAPVFVDGQFPGTRALHFDGQTDRVVVFPSPSLSNPWGIRISSRIWLEDFGQRRNVVEGYLSFALLVENNGMARAGVYDGTKWRTTWSQPGIVQLRQWTSIKFVYNGMDTSALYVNGALAGYQWNMLSPVRGVRWPFGLNIGAWPDGDRFTFRGKIEEVKIWVAKHSICAGGVL